MTGDDFGLNSKANEAIEQLHQAGLLTQTSLMVNEQGVDEALRIARRNPGLCVGLHLTLCLGSGSPSLRGTPLLNGAGELPASPAMAGLRYAIERRLRRHLEREIEEQFARFMSFGFAPAYWDGHTHLHLHPLVMKLALPMAGAAGFKAVRLVHEEGGGMLPAVFRLLSRAAGPQLRAAGIRAPNRIYGLRHTGRITTARFASYIDAIAALAPGPARPTGASERATDWSEIYLHPGAEPEPLDTGLLLAALREKEIVLGHAGELHLAPGGLKNLP